MDFVGFDLVGKKKIDEVIDIGNGSGKNGQGMGLFVKMHGAATIGTGDLRPRTDIFETGFGKNLGTLADEYFLSLVDTGRQTGKGIGESVLGVEEGVHLDVGIY